MTTREILSRLRGSGKTISRQFLYRLFKDLNIAPRGCRQVPAQYPDWAIDRIKLWYARKRDWRKRLRRELLAKNFSVRRSHRER